MNPMTPMNPMTTTTENGMADLMLFVAMLVGAAVLIALPLLWALTSAAALSSLRKYPDLVPNDVIRLNVWKVGVWVPFLGPATYLLAMFFLRAALGGARWREARSRPQRLMVLVGAGAAPRVPPPYPLTSSR